MERFQVTAELLKGARTYLPFAEKARFVEDCAQKCFDRVNITFGEESVPALYRENFGLKARYLTTALVRDYLGIPCTTVRESDGTCDLMDEEDFDRFSESNLYGQILAWKREGALRRVCVDLLADYQVLERWFTSSLRSWLDIHNDAVLRQSMASRELVQQLPRLLEWLQAHGNQDTFSEEAMERGGEAEPSERGAAQDADV